MLNSKVIFKSMIGPNYHFKGISMPECWWLGSTPVYPYREGTDTPPENAGDKPYK